MATAMRKTSKRAFRLDAARWFAGVVALTLGACAHANYLPGTTVPDTADNRAILETVERYRDGMLRKDVEGLVLLASDKYFEDGGTPRPEDDYGYEGLKKVLISRLARVRTLRYDIQYRNVNIFGDRAEVYAFLDGSFELVGEGGDAYRRKSDYHRFVLERASGEKWRFVSGM